MFTSVLVLDIWKKKKYVLKSVTVGVVMGSNVH